MVRSQLPKEINAERRQRSADKCADHPSLRHHPRHLDLHLGAGFHQPGHLHAGHGGEVATHDFAVDRTQFFQAGVVLVTVDDVPGHAHHVFGAGAGLLQHGEHVEQGLAGLGDEVVRLELLLRIPADLAAHEDHGAARLDAVGIALGAGPAGGLKELHKPSLSGGLF